ncbi:MAG: hypothetical protein K8J08_06980 [Thermoanaerobaculia bacterium]|nr:hypothetical protein [Thermoanaerobaculia bacterium]
MRHFRAKLTRLQNTIVDVLPDTEDIYGFSGVDKALLVEGLKSAHGISSEIPEDKSNTRFEIVMLKRFGDQSYERAKELLASDFDRRGGKKRFNELLNIVGSLGERTKATYFIVAQEGLRSDVELASIKELSANLRHEGETLRTEIKKLQPRLEIAQSNVDEAISTKDQILEVAERLDKASTESEALATRVGEQSQKVDSYFSEIEGRREAFSSLKGEVLDLQSDFVASSGKLEALVSQGHKAATKLQELEKKNADLLEEASRTLGDANRVGMAASFRERKRELGIQLVVWQCVFIGATACIASLSGWLLVPGLESTALDWTWIWSRVAIIAPIVWLAWFAARQYGSTARIREDYAFKYAAAMAFEGHKKAIREVDPDLESRLLELSLSNMAQNPIRLYSMRQESATPLHALVRPVLDKLPSVQKKTGRGQAKDNSHSNAITDRSDA